jgi:hypothetical protein
MKCEYSKTPPCVRCTKAGRECIPQIWMRSVLHPVPSPSEILRPWQTYFPEQGQHSNIPTPPSVNSTLPSPLSGSFRREYLCTAERPRPAASERNYYGKADWKSPSVDLPSIYSTSPIEVVNVPSAETSTTSDFVLGRTKRRKSHAAGMSQVGSGSMDSDEDGPPQHMNPVPKQELRDMIYK